jgi:hypothetical protein
LSNSSAGRPYSHYRKKHQQDQRYRPAGGKPGRDMRGCRRPADQGIVFHGRLILAEPKPFEQALRKIEFIHGRLWSICPPDVNEKTGNGDRR